METESIEEILKGIGCEDAPADVRKIAEQTFENFTTTLTQPRQHVLRRVGARSTMIRFAAAAIIIAAVIVGVQNFFRPKVALADVAANMQSMPWMHTISIGNEAGEPVSEEVWASFGSKIVIEKKASGAVNYVNQANNQQKVYDPHVNIINVVDLTGPEVGVPTNSAVELIDRMIEKDKEKLVTYKTEGDLAVYEFDGSDKQCIDNVRLTVDLRTKLPVTAVRKTKVIATGRTTEAMINYEFPQRGPQDIYALGVPADAKLIYGPIKPDIQLADELEQVNGMYAAADIDGLVAILAEARYHQSKVRAANYLAEIGDLRGIAPLQKLGEESNDPDNPFGKAAARIRSRLEKVGLKTAPKDDNDMDVVSLVPPEANAVPLPTPVNLAASGSVYDHFLFTRGDQTDGGKSINTPVLARITAKGFEFRDIDMRGKFAYRLGEGLLCVVAGTLYARHGKGELSAMNLSTGQTELLASDDDDSVYSLLNVYGGHSYVYDDGRLYGQAGKDEGEMTLRVLDFRTHAYRDITILEHELEYTSLTLSPDHKRLAYFAQDPNGNLLTVVDVASGQVMHPSEPIKFVIPVISSSSWYAPPLVWADTNRVVCIRTEVGSGNMNGAVNKVAVIDVTTGQMEDIVPLPENPYFRFVSMTQKYRLAGPRIRVGNVGQFSIDLAERKLIEDDSVNGDYLVSDGYLFYGEQELGGSIKHDGLEGLEVSPDGKRAIWISDGKLYYHDSASEAAVPVLQEGSASGGLHWFRAEDLKAPAVAPGVPPGWIAFKDRPPRVKDA
ncbi:MAG: TolB-like translocation protein, partial [Planctomycetota bacterium]